MKALSITEPYATLIRNGVKQIETRSWKTNYRGELFIHASSTKIPKQYMENKELMELVTGDLNFGHIICKVKLVDCIEMTNEFINKVKQNHNEYISGFYEVGRYAWILEDIEPINPIKAKGKLGLWNYKEEKPDERI